MNKPIVEVEINLHVDTGRLLAEAMTDRIIDTLPSIGEGFGEVTFHADQVTDATMRKVWEKSSGEGVTLRRPTNAPLTLVLWLAASRYRS